MSKTLKFSLLALILIVLGWAYASPYWVLHQIKQAADQNDSDKISSYIDYPSVRDSLKLQLQAQMNSKINTQGNDALSKLGSLFASSMADQLVDSLVTPEAMTLLFKAKGLHDDSRKSADATQVQTPSTATAGQEHAMQASTEQDSAQQATPQQSQTDHSATPAKTDYRAGYQSPNRFVVEIKDPHAADVDVVMQRSGLSWTISEVKLLSLP